ncbi:MAG: glycosyltransferase [Methylococcales bacterium]|nr:glycosyltransferase [Methylococcales bacterium]
MKILLTVHQFFPQFSAGTEILTYAVARELINRGHEVRILTGAPANQPLSDANRCDDYTFEGIQIYRFHHAYTAMGDQTSMLEIDYDNHLAAQYFRQIIDNFHPDIVHFFHFHRLGTGLIDQAVQAGIPAFMTPTDFWAICNTAQLLLCNGKMCSGPSAYAGNCVKHFAQNKRNGLVGKVMQYLPTPLVDGLVYLTQQGVMPNYPNRQEVLAASNRLHINIARLNQLKRIISPTSLVTELLINYGIAPECIIQSAFGIDVTGMSSLRSPPRQPLRIGFIGTLVSHKGVHILIEAFKALPPNVAILNIYGSPENFPDYANGLTQLADNHSGITFCGTFPNAAIADIFADLDVLVVPSLWYENTPLVLYSAQAARCPVVASNFAGLSDVIGHEDNGLLFTAGDTTALTTQLSRLINEPQLLEQLSHHARQPKSTSTYVDELIGVWNS